MEVGRGERLTFSKPGGDPINKGTGNTCARKLRGICRIDPFWDIFYKTSHGQLLPKTPLLENQIWLLWINDWLLLMNKTICVNFALCNCLFVRGGTLCAGLVWPMCPTQPPAGSTASAPISRLIIARTSILVSSKMVILTMTQVLLTISAAVHGSRSAHPRHLFPFPRISKSSAHSSKYFSKTQIPQTSWIKRAFISWGVVVFSWSPNSTVLHLDTQT